MLSIHLLSDTNHLSPQARTEFLRRKARAALQSEGKGRDDEEELSGGSREHLNLFPLEESSEKKGNEEYLREKKEEKVIVLPVFTLFFIMFFFVETIEFICQPAL